MVVGRAKWPHGRSVPFEPLSLSQLNRTLPPLQLAPPGSLTRSFHQAGKISEEYEKRGGGYENEPGSKNEPTKGAPKPKPDDKKEKEVKEHHGEGGKEEKPKANSGKKATGKKADSKPKAPRKETKPPTEGTRKSSRIGNKRSAPADEEKPAAKKAKNGKK